jgi:hypothetical protein
MIDNSTGLASPELKSWSVEWKETTGMIDKLIKEARQGLPVQRSTVLPQLDARRFDGPAAIRQITSRPDFTSYHLLWALRQVSPPMYRSLPDAVKARVLADALANVQALNDWGYLDPSGSSDGPVALALLALGCTAVGPLLPLLSDDRPAPLFGSEAATLSDLYRYRRKDFAYRYISLLIGGTPKFDVDPATRDAAIEQLAATLPKSSEGACR